MDLGLKGKRVLVTGGTRGIGATIVDSFLEEGAIVAFCSRNQQEVDARLNALKAKGYTVFGAACDVANATSYVDWINVSIQQMGGLDVFVPNVSGGANAGEEGWKTAFDVDLMATVRGCDAVVPHLAQSKGAITVIASIAGLEAAGGPSPYNTVKTALITYASQLGEIAAPHGVRVNSISPGPVHVDDGFWGEVQRTQPEMYQAVAARHPQNRLATTNEVANGVVFVSSSAASWITRTNMIIDGGFTQRVQF